MKKFLMLYGVMLSQRCLIKKIILISAVLMSFIFKAHAYNNHDFKGNYAFKLAGLSSVVSTTSAVTVATGQLSADGSGNVTGRGSFRSDGITCDSIITGTYSIGLDGEGIISSIMNSPTPGCLTTPLDLAVVVSNKGTRFYVSSNENDYMDGRLSRQLMDDFVNANLRGSFALQFSGTSALVSAQQQATVGVGVMVMDGKGQVIGNGTLRSFGTTCHGIFKGTYNLAKNGIGKIVTNFITKDAGCSTQVVNFNMAAFSEGHSVELSSAKNDYLIGSLNRQILK